MSIPITADHFCVSAADATVSVHLLARLLEHLSDTVITVITTEHPDGITLTVTPHDPSHAAWHLYGAAFIDGTTEPDIALPVIALDTIRQIHVW